MFLVRLSAHSLVPGSSRLRAPANTSLSLLTQSKYPSIRSYGTCLNNANYPFWLAQLTPCEAVASEATLNQAEVPPATQKSSAPES